MRDAEKALKASEWGAECESVRTEYPARDLSILDLLPPGVSKGWALERLAARLGVDRKETMAIGDNWNDVDDAGVGRAGNRDGQCRPGAAHAGRRCADGSRRRPNDEDGVAVVLEAELAKLAAGKSMSEELHRRPKLRGKILVALGSIVALALMPALRSRAANA